MVGYRNDREANHEYQEGNEENEEFPPEPRLVCDVLILP